MEVVARKVRSTDAMKMIGVRLYEKVSWGIGPSEVVGRRARSSGKGGSGYNFGGG